jgi:hypothetical protein
MKKRPELPVNHSISGENGLTDRTRRQCERPQNFEWQFRPFFPRFT